MKCPSCGHENREGARFCLGCGASLALSCPGCDKELPPGARFCDSCGQVVGELAPTPARPPTPQPSRTLATSFAAGRYRVQRFLGEGGKKRVYLAHDTRLDRDVAFSLIKTEGLDAARDGPGDREKALTLLTQALDITKELGMERLVGRTEALLGQQ